jgi:hypothetical protein
MRKLLVLLVLLAPVVLTGCGDSPALHTGKMTDEEIRQMKEQDSRIDDEERGGSGTAVNKKKKSR